MTPSPRQQHTRAALQYVLTSEMPTQHKTVLIDLLTQALRDQDDDRIRASTNDSSPTPWQNDEIDRVHSFLDGKVAGGWQHADELLMHLATQLERSPKDVREKAIELGYAASVDYAAARTHRSKQPEPMPTTGGRFR